MTDASMSGGTIAVIGMACRFPGAADGDAFWRLLDSGRCAVSEIPGDRWDWTRCDAGAAGSAPPECRWGAFMDGVDRFDAGLFKVSPKEAALMDPQQRLTLELSWACFEDAGYAPSRLAGSDVGVFVGVCNYDYKELQDRYARRGEGHFLTGTANTIIPNRVSYFFDLHGPSLSVDTACSSSLFAVHHAVRSLQAGECSMALAGGINVMCSPERYVPFSRLGMLSPRGRCSVFDAGADGYVRGEGAGYILLKPLDRAVADGDRVLGVIRGVAVNHGGRVRNLTSPNAFAQAKVIMAALRAAGVDPAEVDCIEAHGTGTPLGDPIEVNALRRAFSRLRRDGGAVPAGPWCRLGSVKTNIGHLEGAAGIAGVIKILLMLRHGRMPALHGFETLNPRIDLDGSPFTVLAEPCPWPRGERPRIAGVSSFGFGGANAHLLIGDAPDLPALPRVEPDGTFHIVPLSARTGEGLRALVRRYRDFLGGVGAEAAVADIAFTARTGRDALERRIALIAADAEGLRRALDAFLEGRGDAGLVTPDSPPSEAAGDALTAWLGSKDGAPLPGGAEGRRVGLPTYPFAANRHWLSDAEGLGHFPGGGEPPVPARTVPVPPSPSPLPAPSPSVPAPVAAAVLLAADPVVADHRVRGQAILPGAASLALALRAAGPEVRGLRDVAWLRPIGVPGAFVTFDIRCDGGRFDILSGDPARSVSHVSGRLATADGQPDSLPTAIPESDLRTLPTIDPDALYGRFAGAGIDYGPAFRVIRQLQCDGARAVAELRLAPGSVAALPGVAPLAYLLDGAFQATAATLAEPGAMPVDLGSLALAAPVPDRCRAVVRKTADGAAPRFDIDLLDEAGHRFAAVRDLAVRRSADAPIAYRPFWVPVPVERVESSAASGAGPILIVAPRWAAAVASGIAGRVGERARPVFTDDPAGLEAVLAGGERPAGLWFLGALVPPDVDPEDPAALADSQRTGVMALFALLKRLERRGWPSVLRVVTNGVFAVAPDDRPLPPGASAVGLVTSLAREVPEMACACLDLPAEFDAAAPPDWLLDGLFRAPPPGPPPILAIRPDGCHVRRLESLRLPEAPLRLRPDGAYLIVGGASGIGLETAVAFARAGRDVRLVIVGRRALEDGPREALARIAEAGGRWHYAQADIADAAGIAAAVRDGVAAFGPLRGVVHSALALADRAFPAMDEATFRRALDPKVAGCAALAAAVAGQPLDFMLFYSSALSFLGNAGQTNYAAASAFEDAFAARLAATRPFSVRTVNWGYWGEVGVVAGEAIRERLARSGIHSIATAEGMRLLPRLLAGPVGQVVAIKADAPVLEAMGVETGRTAEASAPPPVPPDLGGLEALAAGCFGPDRFQETAAAFAAMEAIGRAGFAAVLDRLEGQATDARFDRLTAAMRAAVAQGETVTADEKATASARLAALGREVPPLAGHARLLAHCLDALPDVLAGKAAGTDVLFGEGRRGLVAGIYRGHATADAYNDLIAATVRAVLDALRRRDGDERTSTILEAGAGTGGTSASVLPAVSATGDAAAARLRYLYTDLSLSFLREGRERFGASYPFTDFRTLDVAAHPGGQGYERGGVDVVVAANVLHATADIGRTLRHLKWLLKPGGVLVLGEAADNKVFLTATFGLLDGWWAYGDGHRRMPHGPLLSPDLWRRALHAEGFTQVKLLTAPAGCGEHLAQCVVVAVSDGIAGDAPLAASPQVPATAAAAVARSAVSGGSPAPDRPDPQMLPDPQTLAEQAVGEALAEATGIGLADLDRERAFSDYGVDSLVGVDLVRKVGERLGTPLRTTLVFDHPTIRSLAAHLVSANGDAVAARLAGPAPQQPAAPSSAPEPAPVVAAPAEGPSGPLAAVIRGPGAIGDVALEPLGPLPDPLADEVQILVRAAALNFGDLLCVKGLYPSMPDFPFAPGFEVAGLVHRVGPAVTGLRPGDAVVALTGATLGGLRSVATTRAAYVVRKPANLDFAAASALPVAFVTAEMAFRRAALAAGDWVLIQTAAGGLGLVAVQLARRAGARVIGTAGSDAKRDHLRRIGVEVVLDYRQPDFKAAVRAATGGRGVDVVLNTLPPPAMQWGIDALAPGGRYVELAMTGLRAAGGLDLSGFVHNQTFITLDARRALLERPELAPPLLETMVTLAEAGALVPAVDRVLPFGAVAEALRRLDGAANMGKVVLCMDEPALPAGMSVAAAVPEPAARGGAVAVIGMAGRFPGAADLDAFWDNLAAGICSVGGVPPDRWTPDEGPAAAAYRHGAFLAGIDRFDPMFFNVSGREAEMMDPQQRLFLQSCWHAIEDAGIAPDSLGGRNWGVFLGGGTGDYTETLLDGGLPLEGFAFTGNEASVCAARIAYLLNLKGPALAVGTACSSSLVAMHQACRSLADGDCEAAIVGGVFINTTPRFQALCASAGMLSPTGLCHSFDDRADGFVPGEGVAALVLKPLDRALADGDPIHGVIRAIGVNQDGKTNGITAPSVASQTALERAVYERGGIDPATIGYVECHGTGTRLGDPIEIEALTAAFRTFTDRRGFCGVGSVKTNIGHTVTAAGVAGVIKILLAMRHGRLPASLHLDQPNTHIDFAGSPFFIVDRPRDWPAGPLPRRAAVSSFGFSGTNAHAVIEEPPPRATAAVPAAAAHLFCFSAKTEPALRTLLAGFAGWLRRRTDARAADVAYTLLVGRSHFPVRFAVVAGSLAELAGRLEGGTPGGAEVIGAEAIGGADGDRAVLRDLATRYVQGSVPDAARLFPAGAARRIGLPGYPFAEERYWPPARRAPPAAVRLTVAPESLWLRDHRVAGRRILPGAVLLEMARAATGEGTGAGPQGVVEVSWLRPVEAGEGPVELVARPSADGRSCELCNGDGDGAPYLRLGFGAPPPEPFSPPEPLDLDAVRGRCAERLDAAACHALLEARGLRHGPALRVIDHLLRGDGEVLARLNPPEEPAAAPDAVLHPALLDGAFQALAALVGTGDRDVLVPQGVARLGWTGPLRAPCLVHARALGEQDGRLRFDVRIGDPSGALLAWLDGVSVARLPEAAGRPAVLHAEPVWLDAPLDTGAAPALPPGAVLVLDRDGALAERLGRTLDARWPVIAVPAGDAAPGRFDALLDRLETGGLRPAALVQVWRADVGPGELDGTLYPLLGVIRSLARRGAAVRVVAALAGDGGPVPPLFAALPALFGSLVKELPGWSGQTITVTGPEGAMPGGLAGLLDRELRDRGPLAAEILVEGERRRVRRLREVAATAVPAAAMPAALRSGAVTVISGGLGGLGRIFTEHLALGSGATVVLLGRSDPDAERRLWLEELRGRGASIHHVKADVADPVQTAAAVAEVRRRFGRIDGVLHAAGVVRDGSLLSRAEEDVAAVFGPKALGAVNLDAAIGDAPLDVFVLFSSLAGQAGNRGQAAYAFANRFLDGFADWREEQRRQGRRRGRTLSLSWPLWDGGGIALTPVARAQLAREAGLAPMSGEDGLRAFEAALASASVRRAVLAGDAARLRAFLDRVGDGAGGDGGETALAAPSAMPAAPVRAEDVGERAEAWVRAFLAEALKLPPGRLGTDQPFEQFGIDSILVATLTGQLRKRFGDLPETLLFEHPTIGRLAGFLAAEHGDRFAPPPSAAVPAADAAPPPAAGASGAVPVGTARPPAAVDGIAIVGLAGRYPGSPDVGAFWENLKQGRDLVREIPADRWDARRYGEAESGKGAAARGRWGSFLDGVDRFDPLFFNIAPREAAVMDPQERLFLETAWTALEDAGYSRAELQDRFGGAVGVFVGVMWSDYQLYGVPGTERSAPRPLGSSFASIANRVSYFLDAGGPSMAVDTMCSSSLTSVHLAGASLERGECRIAIAGGVNLSLHPNKYRYLAREGFLSSDGRCRSFGEGGDGYVPGEGVGAVVLKRLADALADGDRILAVIRASAVNHGGRAQGYTVPNPRAQAALIRGCLEKAGVEPGSIGYVEAHGTGTALGDPIELRALTLAFGGAVGAGGTDDATDGGGAPCAIGSVKSNIGHLESAAGIAAVTKAVLQLQHRQLAPSLHAERLNPRIDWQGTRFRVQRELADWPSGAGPLRAAVSSFGAGGSNAHLVLERHADPVRSAGEGPQLLPLSARDERGLAELATRFVERFGDGAAAALPPLADIAFTLQVGRDALDLRLAIVAETPEEWLDRLRRFARGDGAADGLWSGSVLDRPAAAGEAGSSGGGAERARRLIAAGDLAGLAALWVREPVKVDWRLLHAGRPPRRVSLPTYPFARQRCWAVPDPAPDPVPAAAEEAGDLRFLVRRLRSGSLGPDDALAALKGRGSANGTGISAGIRVAGATLFQQDGNEGS
ncbi:SDR family NAD(P)-dependent oxidoreductase [Azospirillum argentinense]